MTVAQWLGFGLVFVALLLLFAFWALARSRAARPLRPLPPLAQLRRAIGEAVESGQRLHLSLGHGTLTGPQSALALVGLTVLGRLGRIAAVADRPPVASAGTGPLGLLAQGTLTAAFRESGVEHRMHPLYAQITGLIPEAYIAGAMMLAADPHNAAEVFLGNFGPLGGLLTDVVEQRGGLSVAGTDHVPTQAVFYATASAPLIGEEPFAAGAYLGAGPFHSASLQVQDGLRWLLIGVMVLGGLLKLLGVLP